MTHRPSKLDRSPSSLSLLCLSLSICLSPRSPRPPPTTALLPRRRDLHCSFSVLSSHLAARPPPLHFTLASLWVTRNSRNVVSLAYDRARQCMEEFICGLCPPPIDLPTAPCHVASVSLSRQVRNFLPGSMGPGKGACLFGRFADSGSRWRSGLSFPDRPRSISLSLQKQLGPGSESAPLPNG